MTYSIFTETLHRFDPQTGEPSVRATHWIQADGRNVALMHGAQHYLGHGLFESQESADARALELAQQIVAALNAAQSVEVA